MNNLLDAIIAAKLAGGGGGGGGGSSGLTEDVKQALLNCFAHVAWTDEHGQDYVDALEAALYPLDRITALYTQSGTVYDTDSLDSLRADLVVTAFYQGGDSKTVAAYTLSGTLTEGTSTITVSYGGKTTTFDVVVTEPALPTGYTAVTALKATQSGSTSTYAKQYLRLGFSADATKKYKIETEIKWATTQPAQTSTVFPMMFMSNAFVVGIKNGYYMNFGSTAESDLAASTTDFDVIAAQGDFVSLDYEFSVNGETRTMSRSAAVAERAAYLFASAPGSGGNIVSACACSMKRTKIYVDDVLYMDLVPCLRNSDSVAGMYDRIGQSFLHSAGANEFTYEE